jgi:hypothetical protein
LLTDGPLHARGSGRGGRRASTHFRGPVWASCSFVMLRTWWSRLRPGPSGEVVAATTAAGALGLPNSRGRVRPRSVGSSSVALGSAITPVVHRTLCWPCSSAARAQRASGPQRPRTGRAREPLEQPVRLRHELVERRVHEGVAAVGGIAVRRRDFTCDGLVHSRTTVPTRVGSRVARSDVASSSTSGARSDSDRGRAQGLGPR